MVVAWSQRPAQLIVPNLLLYTAVFRAFCLTSERRQVSALNCLEIEVQDEIPDDLS